MRNPESLELLKRDITVLLNAFRRRWGVKRDFEEEWERFYEAWLIGRKEVED